MPGKNPTQPVDQKDWTVLAYLAGDNNLVEEMVWSLQELKKTAAGLPNVNVIAQFDPRGENPRLYDFSSRKGAPAVQDGELSIPANTELTSARNTWETVRNNILPTREHLALAANLLGGGEGVVKYLEKHKVPTLQAERFAGFLLLLPRPVRTKIKDNQSRLAAILSEPEEPTADDLARSEQIVRQGRFLELVDSLPEIPDKDIRPLAFQIARSSDSVLRNISGLTSQLQLREFLGAQLAKVDSANVFLVLSGHGSGAVGDFLTDEDPQSALSIPKLGALLRDARKQNFGGKKIAVLGMDSCLMSMIEVCYEVRDSVDYLVGSEGFVENTGWPYHRILEAVGKNKDPRALATELVERFLLFYKDYEMAGTSVDISAIDLNQIRRICQSIPEVEEESVEFDVSASKFDQEYVQPDQSGAIDSSTTNIPSALLGLSSILIKVLKELHWEEERCEVQNGACMTKKAGAREVRNALILAHWYAQSYKREQYVDIYDFCEQLKRFCRGTDSEAQEIRDWCGKIIAIIDGAASPVVDSAFWGPDFQHSHGLSIYFPWSVQEFLPEYCGLSFARDTRWAEFLWHYLRVTLRLRRGHPSNDQPVRYGSRRYASFFSLDAPPGDFTELRDAEVGTRRESGVARRDAEVTNRRDAEVGTFRDAEVGTFRDAEVGTFRDAEVGTKKFLGKSTISSWVKNRPDGFLRPRPKTPKKGLKPYRRKPKAKEREDETRPLKS